MGKALLQKFCMTGLPRMLLLDSAWNSRLHLFSSTSSFPPPRGQDQVQAWVGRFTCQIEGRWSQWLPGGCAEEGCLICWNSQKKTNKKIYHHIGVEFLLFKSWISSRLFPPATAQNVSVSGSSWCQEKIYGSAWEITLACKVALQHLTLAYLCSLPCTAFIHAPSTPAKLNGS